MQMLIDTKEPKKGERLHVEANMGANFEHFQVFVTFATLCAQFCVVVLMFATVMSVLFLDDVFKRALTEELSNAMAHA